MKKDVSELGTILGVWAHPDDEAYLSAALMAWARRNDQRVVVVTATKGEAGTWNEERWPTPTMGEIREAELMRCLEILGVSEHSWLGIYDGTADKVALEDGVAMVQPFIEEVRQKMHQFVIHELGPLLTDQRVSETELRRQVDEQLLKALSQERFALTVAERQEDGHAEASLTMSPLTHGWRDSTSSSLIP